VLEIDDASSGDEESEEEGDDFEEDEELAAARRRLKGKDRDEEPREEATEDPVKQQRGNLREKPVRTRDSGYPNMRDSGYTNTRPTRGTPTNKNAHQLPSTRDPAEPRPSHVASDGPSLRELKRQAYLGPPVDAQRVAAHPSRSRKVQSKPAPTQEDGKTGGTRKPVAGEGKVPSGRAPVGGYAAGGARRKDGRPNLNARMGVLLEQIQRTK
jgi:hypothetical protein